MHFDAFAYVAASRVKEPYSFNVDSFGLPRVSQLIKQLGVVFVSTLVLWHLYSPYVARLWGANSKLQRTMKLAICRADYRP
jgi:hypothetical protein